MKKFNFIQILYFLPVFFFTLAGSPNMVGWRIGVVLGLFYMILIPTSNYVGALLKRLKLPNYKFSVIDIVVLIILFTSLFLGWRINWQYGLLQVVFAIYITTIFSNSLLLKKFSLLIILLLGLLIFIVTYIGLNQYGFLQLTSIHNVQVALLCSLLVLRVIYPMASELNKPNWLNALNSIMAIEVMGFFTFFFYYFSWNYAIFFGLALIPANTLFYRLKAISAISEKETEQKLVLIRRIYALVVTAFFIYFFLDSTHVIQALLGGY